LQQKRSETSPAARVLFPADRKQVGIIISSGRAVNWSDPHPLPIGSIFVDKNGEI
jgi:hypothetical protein